MTRTLLLSALCVLAAACTCPAPTVLKIAPDAGDATITDCYFDGQKGTVKAIPGTRNACQIIIQPAVKP